PVHPLVFGNAFVIEALGEFHDVRSVEINNAELDHGGDSGVLATDEHKLTQIGEERSTSRPRPSSTPSSLSALRLLCLSPFSCVHLRLQGKKRSALSLCPCQNRASSTNPWWPGETNSLPRDCSCCLLCRSLLDHCKTGFYLAVPLCDHAFRQCFPALFAPADDRQDGATVFGWQPGRLEHLHGVLPGGALGRLSLCARLDSALAGPPAGDRARPI